MNGLSATFTRRPGEHDLVQVVRSDATTTAWPFPTYGDALPHDLVHFVVEQGLGLSHGFWGLIDQGAEIVIVDDQAVLSRGGIPLREPTVDLSGLTEAEEAVALLGPQPIIEEVGGLTVARLVPDSFGPPAADGTVSGVGFRLPPGVTDETIASIHATLRDLTQRWRRPGGRSITVTWRRSGEGTSGSGRADDAPARCPSSPGGVDAGGRSP